MSNNITFAVRGIHALYPLPLGDTILHFIQSDFTYFREQCVDAVNKYQSFGTFSLERVSIYKEYIRGCHPYCSALINSVFDKIVLDCMIDYLCESNQMGLEELWVKKLSSSDSFGRAIFHRITEYKTGTGINQWTNLLRMQKYAATKLAFLFDGDMSNQAEYEARKLYFDMTFMLSAQELGCDASDLPQVRRYSLPLLPGSSFLLRNAVNTINPVVKSMTDGRKVGLRAKGMENLHDQIAGMAVSSMLDLQRPLAPEIRQLSKAYGKYATEVYEPSSFKAIIDLEFDKFLAYGMALQKSPETGDYFIVSQTDHPEVAEEPGLVDAPTEIIYAEAVLPERKIPEESSIWNEEIPAPAAGTSEDPQPEEEITVEVAVPVYEEFAPEEAPAPAAETSEDPQPEEEITVEVAIPVYEEFAPEETPAPAAEISEDRQPEEEITVEVSVPVYEEFASQEAPAPAAEAPKEPKPVIEFPIQAVAPVEQEFSLSNKTPLKKETVQVNTVPAPEQKPIHSIVIPAAEFEARYGSEQVSEPPKKPARKHSAAPVAEIPSLSIIIPAAEFEARSASEHTTPSENPPAPAAEVPTLHVVPAVEPGLSSASEDTAHAEKKTSKKTKKSDTAEHAASSIAPDTDFDRIKALRKEMNRRSRKAKSEKTVDEINMRCNQLWNEMNARVGEDISPEENREWFKILIDLRRQINADEITPEELDHFIDATEKTYQIQSGLLV
jgi:hypothetical protein